MLGTTLWNRYKIKQVLGSGGFGNTYIAIDLGLPGQPYCVVKHLKPKDPNPAVLPIAKSLFEREARILYQLGNKSEQIPRLFAHFEENGEFYLVQEFVDGHDLTQEIVTHQPSSEDTVFTLLKDILEVLVFVHQDNIIHRDIKPQNLRRRRDGKIVLIDFGAVKEISALGVNPQGHSSFTVAVGSPSYMPSEQASGKPKLSSDIYAVGMIGIQALTGIMPLNLPEDPESGEVIWRDKAQVSNSLGDVLDTMVRHHFSFRYHSAAEALQALTASAVLSPPDITTTNLVNQPQSSPLPQLPSSPSLGSQTLPPTPLVHQTPFSSQPLNQQASAPIQKATFKHKWTVAAAILLVPLGGAWLYSAIRFHAKPISVQAPIGTVGSSVTVGTTSKPKFSLQRFADVQNIPTGEFSYGGSTTWVPVRAIVDAAIQSERPEFHLRYVNSVNGPPSSSNGIRMLLDGELSFAQSSRPILDKEYNQAQQRGLRLKQIAVALDGYAIAVHPSLNLPGLTLAQVKSIYTGQIVNWKAVGGPDLKITPYARQEAGWFALEALSGQPFGKNIEIVPNTTQGLQKLAQTPGGVYYASAALVVPQCRVKALPLLKQPGQWVSPYQEPLVPQSQCPERHNQMNVRAFQRGDYPLTRNLFVIIKQDGQIDQQAGEAYADFLLTAQGQELISKAGFVKIH